VTDGSKHTGSRRSGKSFDRSIIDGPIRKAVWTLAWPTMLQNVIGGIQGLVDHLMVGNYVGYTGNAAIGVSWQIFLVVIVFISSVFSGMGVLVARFSGRNDRAMVNRTVQQSFMLAVGLALGIMAPVGYVLAPVLLDLINAAPDPESKRFLATQTLDEARHVEIFTQRLYDLGVKKSEFEQTLTRYASPHLVQFAEVLLEKVDKGDFIAGVVGQNIVLEGLAFSVFEMMQAANVEMNPKFAQTLSGTIADERRHVGFGENRIGSLIKEHPEKKPEIEKMQKDMAYHMLATFAERFRGQASNLEETRRLAQEAAAQSGAAPKSQVWHGADLSTADPAEMEAVLSDTVLKEFKTRLGRIGLEYQTPARP